MSLSDQKAKSAAMAAMMKKNPGRYPDSVMRPHRGCGSNDRISATKLGSTWVGRHSSTWEKGMLGGVLAAKCGFGSNPYLK